MRKVLQLEQLRRPTVANQDWAELEVRPGEYDNVSVAELNNDPAYYCDAIQTSWYDVQLLPW